MLFPGLQNKRIDILGILTSIIFTIAIAGIFGILIYAVADGYLDIKIDKVTDPIARAHELINAVYTIIIVALGIMCLEKMRSTLARSSDIPIFLRLPVKNSTIFRAKFSALLLWTYVTAFMLIIPVNAIFYFVLGAGREFLINTVIVYALLPMVSFLFATVLILPYMIIIKFLSTRYFLSFVSLSVLVVGAFFVYSSVLGILRGLFETGSIKFLFTSEFVNVLMGAKGYTYPANALASLLLGISRRRSFLISAGFAAAALLVAFVITGALYRLVLYRNRDSRKSRSKFSFGFQRGVTASLLRKEFVTVYREPKYLFSYFTIAFAMPFMIYCCYTLFETLIFNALGRGFEFSLALLVVLVFGILTNTFCATNITRDGKSALKAKSFPVKASKLLFSKVLFCSIISSLSVLGSVAMLYLTVGMTRFNAVVTCGLGLMFSVSQILIATRTDLNCAVVDASPEEVARTSDRTIAKVVSVGLFFAVLIGFVTFFVSVFAGTAPEVLKGFEVKEIYVYLFPAVIALFYFGAALVYYLVNIEKAFSKLTK
jgi:hypothetical protein